MGTEETGFEPEPTYPLAEQAEIQVLRERLYAAQNALARMEGEHRGKVLVDPEDLRAVLLGYGSERPVVSVEGSQAWNRLSALAWPGADRPGHGEPYRDMPPEPQAPTDALRAADGAQ